MCCLLYMISAVVLLSAYFATEKLTPLSQVQVSESRFLVVIASTIHFILALISFFTVTTCSAATLRQDYIYKDKWFKELWMMLDMDNDERHLNKRQEDLEGGDFDEESTFLEPTGVKDLDSLTGVPLIPASPPRTKTQDSFYPMSEFETEDIITIIPEATMNEFMDLMHEGEIQVASGQDSDFTLANALKTLQSSKLGTLRFPTEKGIQQNLPTTSKYIQNYSKLHEMESNMERIATRFVEGIQVKTNLKVAMEPLPSQKTSKPGEERITITETIEKHLDAAIDFEAIANGDLEFISEKLGLGRLQLL